MFSKKVLFTVVGALLANFLLLGSVFAANEIRLKQMLSPAFTVPVIPVEKVPVSIMNAKTVAAVVIQGKKLIAERVNALNRFKKQVTANKILNAQQKKGFISMIDSNIKSLGGYRDGMINDKELISQKDRIRRMYKLMRIFSFSIPRMQYDIALSVLDNHGNSINDKLKILQNKIDAAKTTGKDATAWQTALDKAKTSLAALQNDVNEARVNLYRSVSDINLKQPDNYAEIINPVFANTAKSIKRINQGYTLLARDLLKAMSDPLPAKGPAKSAGLVKDCGNNFDCFIEAAQKCDLAKINHTYAMNLFEVRSTSTLYYELKGRDSAQKCIFYIQAKEVKLEFPPNTSQAIIALNEEAFKQMENRDGTCAYISTVKLVDLLKRWKAGEFQFSSDPKNGDFKDGKCKGDYFTPKVVTSGTLPANTLQTISLRECNKRGGSGMQITENNTACVSSQSDLGSIEGVKINGKSVQCCK